MKDRHIGLLFLLSAVSNSAVETSSIKQDRDLSNIYNIITHSDAQERAIEEGYQQAINYRKNHPILT